MAKKMVETPETLAAEKARVKKILRDIILNKKYLEEVYERVDSCTSETQVGNLLRSEIKKS